MYPLNVVIVGCNDEVLPHVRRELAKASAHVEAEFPDVGHLFARLAAGEQEMRLFVIGAEGGGHVEQIRRLSRVFAGRPILALVDAVSNPSVFIEAMRGGALQVVPVPIDSDDFRAALDCLALHFAYAGKASRVVAVAGVTGGCGATTIAINLAYEIAQQHKLHCILVELSMQMGMLATYLDLAPKFTTHDLLSDMSRVDIYLVQQVLTRVADNFDVLAGPHHDIEPIHPSVENVHRLIGFARQLADVVILDVPSTMDTLYFQTLATANQIVLVGEQKIPSVRNLKAVRSTLERDYDSRMQYVAINRYDPRVQGFTEDQLDALLRGSKLVTIANDYSSVIAAVNHGRTLRLEAPRSTVVRDISRLACLLLNVAEAPKQPKGIFTRLLRPFQASS